MNATSELLQESLAAIVVDMILFAELAGEAEVHPDTALKLLERMLGALSELGASDRLWLYDFVKRAVRDEAHPDNRRVLTWLAGELLEEDG